MTELERLTEKYNKLVAKLNELNKAHVECTQPLYDEKSKLYRRIYELSAQPTHAMIAQVEAKLTAEEKKYVRVLWNTPPNVEGLAQMWSDD